MTSAADAIRYTDVICETQIHDVQQISFIFFLKPSRKSCALHEVDIQYLWEKLGEWISLEHGERLLGSFFSSPEYFWNSYVRQMPDIVLLGDGFLEDARIRAELLRREGVGEELKDSGQEPLWLYLEQREQNCD